MDKMHLNVTRPPESNMIPLTTFISSCPLPCNRVGPLHSRVGVTSIPANKKRKRLSTRNELPNLRDYCIHSMHGICHLCRPKNFGICVNDVLFYAVLMQNYFLLCSQFPHNSR